MDATGSKKYRGSPLGHETRRIKPAITAIVPIPYFYPLTMFVPSFSTHAEMASNFIAFKNAGERKKRPLTPQNRQNRLRPLPPQNGRSSYGRTQPIGQQVFADARFLLSAPHLSLGTNVYVKPCRTAGQSETVS